MVDDNKSQPFKTVIVSKPATERSDSDDFHFKIPRSMIRKGVIMPDKEYQLWVIEKEE